MPRIRTHGIELYYETHGAGSGSPLVLIMGLNAQLIHWPAPLVDRLVERGHWVVSFDNRDVGKSTSFAASGPVDLKQLLGEMAQGKPAALPYTLAQMADDVVGLLDALDLPSAHLVGVSLGGRIAQQVAIARSDRVRSLTSIMSTTGAADLPSARPDVLAKLFAPARRDPATSTAAALDLLRTICANDDDFDEARSLAILQRARARGGDLAAGSRQIAAMLLAGDMEHELRRLRIPALVMHGGADPLLPVACGRRTHACIAGSRLWIDEPMGHYLPQRMLIPIADAISDLTEHADRR
jgi:pimeloyl-ACP methyl ester carboxylesterase